MKLAYKLTLGYLCSAILVVVVGAASYRAVVLVEQQQESISAGIQPIVKVQQQIEAAGLRILAVTGELMWMKAYAADVFQSKEWQHELDELTYEAINPYHNGIARYKQLAIQHADHEIAFINDIDNWGQQLIATSLRMVELVQQGATLTDLNELRESLEDIEKGFLEAIANAKLHETEELRLQEESLRAELARTQEIIVLGSLAAFLIALGLGSALARRMVRPIVSLKNAANALQQGKFNTRVSIPSNDEVGSLATSFNAMGDALGKAAAVFENTSEGVVIADRNVNIVAVNKAFETITGYTSEEVLNKNPRVIKSNRHQPAFYDELWSTLLDKGIWRGEIWNRRKNGEVFPVWQSIRVIYDDNGAVNHFVSVFSDITTIKQSQHDLDHLAYHDPLTDLPNRLLFEDRLSHALKRAEREEHQVALLVLDLDRFKNINDSLGHPVGDNLLIETARRLNRLVREEDTVGRLGGDEFVIIIERLNKTADVATLAQKLIDSFNEPHSVDEHQLLVTLSIGISIYPRDGDDVATLVKNADTALYRAKEEGRNCFEHYTDDLTATIRERLALETALRSAIKHEQLEVYYQPVVTLETGKMVGAETLLRWHHPTRGLIMPNNFISLAEDSGQIIQIGAWVLRQACTQARRWLDQGFNIDRIAVNVSGLQIQRGEFVECVQTILTETGLGGRYLELEITENVIMQNTEKAIGVLKQLKAMGIRISIDDFGTGYSSLSYLKQLPIDKFKIDQSFVRDIADDANDKAITRAVNALAQSLQLGVIAEGIETMSQEHFLQQLKCHEGQGYLYSKPLRVAEFEALLKMDAPLNAHSAVAASRSH